MPERSAPPPRRGAKPPLYRLHQPPGHARVILAGEHIYLGKYDIPESEEAYARAIAERFVLPAAGVRRDPDIGGRAA
ncbi:hypothetical protein [Alienimonas chondri]|uniref:Uncharacterized protein n=1 Tax=Alienimonas chondri TaxID=2681879 RepID=A0ABX1VAK4_9PLAN|nr:hypothetical protein [Alienimonas chondri]NNJ24317.1 hypothetical protein [Alienimonas chondri]